MVLIHSTALGGVAVDKLGISSEERPRLTSGGLHPGNLPRVHGEVQKTGADVPSASASRTSAKDRGAG